MATGGATSSTFAGRSSLPAPGRTYYCTKCRCCVVPEMGDMCVFCEDGQICPEQQQRQRLQKSAPPAKAAPVDEGLQKRESDIDELRSALMNQGWRLPRAKAVAARVVDDHPDASFEERFRGIMAGNWGNDLTPKRRDFRTPAPAKKTNPLVAAIERTFGPDEAEDETPATQVPLAREREKSMPRKEFDVELYKKLVAKGMEQKSIAREMGIGYSTLSTKLKQAREAGKLSREVRAERPPSKSLAKAKPEKPRTNNGHANTSGGAVATLTVSESALDNFWSKLPIEEKARIVQDNLIGALGQ